MLEYFASHAPSLAASLKTAAWVGLALAAWMALAIPRSVATRLMALAGVAVLCTALAVAQGADPFARHRPQAAATAYFNAVCRSAGEVIHRRADGVQDIQLLHVRTGRPQAPVADAQWMGAGMPHEPVDLDYVHHFLQADPVDPADLGTTVAAEVPGYRSVDVRLPEGGHQRHRQADRALAPSNVVLGPEPLVGRPARYAVSYLDLSTSEGRALGIAGAHVAVIDTLTGELMAEMRVFAHDLDSGAPRNAHRAWRTAHSCPATPDGRAPSIKAFVRRVLPPAHGSAPGG